MLRDLKARGRRPPRLVVRDGHLGIWSALVAVFPQARPQRYGHHRLLNLLDKLPTRLQAEGRGSPRRSPTPRPGRTPSARSGHSSAGAPRRVWRRSVRRWTRTGSGRSPSTTSRRRTGSTCEPRTRSSRRSQRSACGRAAAKRYKKIENATAVIWKTLLIAEWTFRRLDAPELLAEVTEGVVYVNGERVKPGQSTAEKKAAAEKGMRCG